MVPMEFKPAPFWIIFSSLFRYVQLSVMGCLAIGPEAVFRWFEVRRPAPQIVVDAQVNRWAILLGTLFLGNVALSMVYNAKAAFEVYAGTNLLHSTLQVKMLPDVSDLLRQLRPL
ncbi:MAG: hypothetical protein KVP17_002908 [Porospora cf. gigantea B]|uniref:uncharacterized protein n=1 Tax=Porospora cf. gigantea B TaxID=2853592 RepID=UPI003571F87E|nr:MAG: hypothetical protein KVP17_002908 [Porospora cf. gigantea B]